MSNFDLVKAYFTYGIAILVVAGGGLLIAIYGNVMDKLVVGAIIGFIGMALNWVFGETTRSSTARALLQTPNAPSGEPGS